MDLMKRMLAEAFGTGWLVLCGCGSAVIAANTQAGGIGLLGMPLAFGLTVLTMAYALGPVSGAHLNPAVTLGLALARRFPTREILPYWLAQVVGTIVAAVLYLIFAMNHSDAVGRFASNGYGMLPTFLTECVLTAVFLVVILGATDDDAYSSMAPVAIGLALTLIHLISIPVTNTSVNPAHSTSQALFAGAEALKQLWLFWAPPLLGAALGSLFYAKLLSRR
ncbi:MAG: aquaporin Z [Candidatus Protistobacter heckmanni]|nr:aquaporin Z [Candidatus Protistobacter heckmanni]